MAKDSYCIFNGHLISIYEPSVSFSNRAFRYGDSLFETIRVCNNNIMFLRDHITRLKLGMTVLRMNLPAEFNSDNIHEFIVQLLKHNTHAPHARVRLTVFRNDGGLYTPETNDISFLIESEELPSGYELNQKGFWVDIYADIKKSINKLSNIKSGNALMYVMAGIAKQSMKLDDCFLINENGTICESISSNIFVVKNGTLYTAPLTEGCVAGVMRKQIMNLATENKILTFESAITTYTLMNGDEIFLTNSINGIQWVGQFKDKFYTNKMALFFIDKLNALTL
ncbi:aminotransferase class IV [Aurantibacillus circumpalustris]|uniref:aminotransferase class IV n=1 Tax=Aurantibacillus circumpalustris TaxID=3036359 RepID=UPI00295AAB57|nr:aminotransferase class IV [Aurantibacillus circumpalustris]